MSSVQNQSNEEDLWSPKNVARAQAQDPDIGPLVDQVLQEWKKPNANTPGSGCNDFKTYGYRVFSHRAPTLWNALPDDIRQVEHLQSFKSKLKTHLFRQL